MRTSLPVIVVAFWWGSLGAVGFVVVPLLFQFLSPAALAGQMAARLFTAQAWIGMLSGLLLLLLLLSRDRSGPGLTPWAQRAVGWLLAAFLMALLLEFGVAPRIVARTQLPLWHSLGSLLYVLEWVCLSVLLWQLLLPLRVAAEPAPQTDAPVSEDAAR